jgi:hypothetical protein
VLRENAMNGASGGGPWHTAGTYCAGRSVHTFLYINVNGVGMSDTSSNVAC